MSKLLKYILLLILILEPSLSFARPIGRRFTSVLSGGGASSGGVVYVDYWTDGVALGNFDSSANWQELSGLATPRLAGNENYMWIVSDAPANMLAAVLKADGSNQGVWDFQSPPTYVDVEDIESQVVSGVSYLYFMDFGNNSNTADSRGAGIDMRILRAVEPAITGSNGTILSANYISIDAAFPVINGPTLRDCEATIVDETGKIYIIIKRDAAQEVYSLEHQASYVGTQTLVYEGNMSPIPSSLTNALGATLTYAVDAAMTPDGTIIFVKNYNNIYSFARDPATQTIFQALSVPGTNVDGYVGGGSVTPAKSHPSQEPQGEGIAFDSNGVDYYSNSEYQVTQGSTPTQYPFFKYSRLNTVPTTITFQDGVSPTVGYAGTTDTYIWDTNGTTNYGTELTFILDNPFDADSRVGLLKFDVSAIPSTATIVGAALYMNIANEGQGWYAHRIINSNWVESTVTWNNIPNGPAALNDVFATSAYELINGVNLDTIQGVIVRNNMSMSTVQGWVDGTYNNNGWIMPGVHVTDGVQFDSHRAVTASNRPQLIIRYTE